MTTDSTPEASTDSMRVPREYFQAMYDNLMAGSPTATYDQLYREHPLSGVDDAPSHWDNAPDKLNLMALIGQTLLPLVVADDDELMGQLASIATQLDPVPPEVTQTAREAFLGTTFAAATMPSDESSGDNKGIWGTPA